jgi:hypothetical protein
MAMPGSTLSDFYEEFTLLWNFKSWGSIRHDYMFLRDANISKPGYFEKYNINLVEVYTDLIDEEGVENQHSFYKNKRNYFKTISSCYSFTNLECCEMWFMNLAGNLLLKNMYDKFQDSCTPAEFGKHCFEVIKTMPEFQPIWLEIIDILNPDTPAKNNKRLSGQVRQIAVESFINDNWQVIYSGVFRRVEEVETV